MRFGKISPLDATFTAAPLIDRVASGVKVTLSANENQAFGDVCTINSTGKAAIARGNVIANANTVVMCADTTVLLGAVGNYLMLGVARNDTWTWTVGGLIYLSITGTTGNTLTQTMPTGTNNVIQIIGIATHADRMIFNPSLIQVEHT